MRRLWPPAEPDGRAVGDGAPLERDALRIAVGVLSGDPPAEEALARITAAALAATEARQATLAVPMSDGTATVRTSAGPRALAPGSLIPTLQGGALATALEGADALTRPSSRADWREAAVPVKVRGRIAGALLVAGDAVPAHAHEVLHAFAQLLAVILSQAEDRRHYSNLARTDPLTGLWNRRAFDERFAAAVEQARRHRQPLSLAMLDLDHFKVLNDSLGHLAGDRALVEVARRLRGTCRAGESMARIGGDEFAWVLPLTPAEGAESAARRAQRAVQADPPEGIGTLSISIGISELALAGGAAELLRRADAALYRAKAEGRDRIIRDTGGDPA
ncbi:MAG: sensor domain-containing diguanylate cyclase [Thermoleophilia bacterium]